MGERKGAIYSTDVNRVPSLSCIILEAEGIVKHKVDIIPSLVDPTLHTLLCLFWESRGGTWGSGGGGKRSSRRGKYC